MESKRDEPAAVQASVSGGLTQVSCSPRNQGGVIGTDGGETTAQLRWSLERVLAASKARQPLIWELNIEASSLQILTVQPGRGNKAFGVEGGDTGDLQTEVSEELILSVKIQSINASLENRKPDSEPSFNNWGPSVRPRSHKKGLGLVRVRRKTVMLRSTGYVCFSSLCHCPQAHPFSLSLCGLGKESMKFSWPQEP